MTFKNDSYSDDLEQIARDQNGNLIALEEIKNLRPDFSAELARIQEHMQINIEAIQEIADKARKENDEFFIETKT